MPTIVDRLARCPRCLETVILVYGEASYRNLALFNAVPWSPLDETPNDESLSEAAYKRWLAQLPYKLYVCYIDFERGTWSVAMARANEKLRPGQPLWKPHNCLREEGDVEPKKADLLPDRPAVKTDPDVVAPAPRAGAGHLANGQRRVRNPRVGRTRDGGV